MIDRLDKSFQSQRQFTADASHELRTPLTILKGEMEVALQQKRETSEYEETLRSAIQEIRRINKTVDDLLLLARLDAGQLSLQLRVVRLDELLMDAVAKVTASCQKKNISIVLDIIGVTEGEDAKELNILGDRDKLMNVFLNLLDNAMKYSGEGKNIRVTVGLATDSAEVRVTDDGIGIHPQDLPHIFDRFYRVDKARSYQDSVETSGSGLGLSIAKWIVEAHKGTISVESLIGKGTTITVRIPLASAIPT
jgi:signal transduction histidine kinase